ncbi:MAG: glycosyltransferase [Lactobacillaceae bacterium]|jgi:poly(glycerol-phosphate) alpha-glucosyltransferase|nr:glycosyltransferase [Lactobacillaceae bacterium]
MKLFVSENIFVFNSGTEHAQARRTKLFNEHGDQALYVTRNYNRFLDRDLQNIGLQADQVLNMYDFFQGAVQIERTEQNLRLLNSIPLDEYHIVSHGANYSTLEHDGRKVGRINVLPGTVGLVSEIIYNDRAGNKTFQENWDWRGFKSSIDTFHADGHVGTQRFLNLAGVTVLEIVHMNVNGTLYPTMWKLLDYKGQNLRFNSENDLFTFFMNEILVQYPDATIISDRRSLDDVIANVQGALGKFAYFHDIHTPDAMKPRTGKPYPAYETILEKRGKEFTAILVPTEAHREDLQARYSNLNFRTAPNTHIDTSMLQKEPDPEAKPSHRMLFLGRLSPEKRPEDAIRALAATQKTIPDATLEFMGYVSGPDMNQKLRDLATELSVSDSVIFTQYGNQAMVAEALQRAQVIVETSVGEGLGMNLVEGLSYSLPIVSYQINYTTTTTAVVEDKVNGFVVPSGSFGTMGLRIADIFQDDEMWQQMRNASFKKAQQFGADQMYAKWQDVLR